MSGIEAWLAALFWSEHVFLTDGLVEALEDAEIQ